VPPDGATEGATGRGHLPRSSIMGTDWGAPVVEIAPLAVQGGGGAFALSDHF